MSERKRIAERLQLRVSIKGYSAQMKCLVRKMCPVYPLSPKCGHTHLTETISRIYKYVVLDRKENF